MAAGTKQAQGADQSVLWFKMVYFSPKEEVGGGRQLETIHSILLESMPECI